MSRQLEILMERRRQEEVRKARHHWSLLRNSIRNTVQAVQEADIKSVVISHGIHHLRKLNHETRLKQVMYIKELNVSTMQCSPFIMLFLGSIGIDHFINEWCYKGTILQMEL